MHPNNETCTARHSPQTPWTVLAASLSFSSGTISLSAREKKERAVGPFHGPGDPGRSLGPDRSEENGITFPAVFPGRSGLLTFRLSLMQVTLWKSTWGYQMVAVALGSASGNTGQLETGMLVYVQYGVIGGQHGVSFFLFLFFSFSYFLF